MAVTALRVKDWPPMPTRTHLDSKPVTFVEKFAPSTLRMFVAGAVFGKDMCVRQKAITSSDGQRDSKPN